MQTEQVHVLQGQTPAEQVWKTLKQDISTRIYFHQIPVFVKYELQLLYGHIRASLPYLKIFKSTGQVNTYVATDGVTPTAIVLFSLSGRHVTVLNDMIQMAEQDVQRFAECIFERFPVASIVRFNSIQATLRHFPYPFQQGPTEENVLITLPATPEEYVASLGKNTRPRIKQQLAKLKRDFPSFSFQTYEKQDIDEQLFHELIDLKGDTIRSKKRRFSIEQDRARQMMALAQQCGVVHVIWIDGQIAAAKIDFRLGFDQVGEVTYNDSRYNSYSLGMVCNFLDIQDSIAKGIRRFHLGPGQNPYKLQLLGVPEEFGQLTIYRSSKHMMRHWDWATTIWINTRVFQSKAWLNNHQNSPITRSLLTLFRARSALREAWARKRQR